MVFGRSAPEPDASVRQLVDDAHAAVRAASERLAVVESRVEQVRLHVREVAKEASRAARSNPQLVELCLDVERLLHGPYLENAEGAG